MPRISVQRDEYNSTKNDINIIFEAVDGLPVSRVSQSEALGGMIAKPAAINQ